MTLMLPKRRGFLFGAGALLLAPAIVRASSLMPSSTLKDVAPVPGPMIDGVALQVGDVVLLPSGPYVVTAWNADACDLSMRHAGADAGRPVATFRYAG